MKAFRFDLARPSGAEVYLLFWLPTMFILLTNALLQVPGYAFSAHTVAQCQILPTLSRP